MSDQNPITVKFREMSQQMYNEKKHLQHPEFNYVPACKTNVQDTWRRHIEQHMPGMKDNYRFLFNA